MNILFEDRFEFLSAGGELWLATFPLEKYSSSPGGHSWIRRRIHERTISLRCLGIILRLLRLEVSVYIVYITNQLRTTFTRGEGRKSVGRGDCG